MNDIKTNRDEELNSPFNSVERLLNDISKIEINKELQIDDLSQKNKLYKDIASAIENSIN